MTHELKRVLLGQKHENEGLIELKEDKWFDPHASGLKVLPHDVAIKNREALRDGILTDCPEMPVTLAAPDLSLAI